jgi:hypothetical protein
LNSCPEKPSAPIQKPTSLLQKWVHCNFWLGCDTIEKPLIKYHHKKCWREGQGGIFGFFLFAKRFRAKGHKIDANVILKRLFVNGNVGLIIARGALAREPASSG